MPKKPAKIDEYRRLALEATTIARSSGLAHVREKHETAAAQWSALAKLEEERLSQYPRTAQIELVAL